MAGFGLLGHGGVISGVINGDEARIQGKLLEGARAVVIGDGLREG